MEMVFCERSISTATSELWRVDVQSCSGAGLDGVDQRRDSDWTRAARLGAAKKARIGRTQAMVCSGYVGACRPRGCCADQLPEEMVDLRCKERALLEAVAALLVPSKMLEAMFPKSKDKNA